MADIIDTSKIKGLEEITEWVKSFCDVSHIPNINFQEEYDVLINMDYGDLTSLSSDDCFANAIMLMNYVAFIQKQKAIVSSQLNWCDEALSYLCAKEWNNYDKFMPADVKRKAVICENSYAESIEKIRIRLKAALSLLEDSYHDLKKRVSILENLGKKRSFE